MRDPAADARAPAIVATIEAHTRALADALDVRGLLNVQYAVKDGQVFVIEANPRASRTVPFVSKATGVPLAKVAARVMVGATLAELRAEGLLRPPADGGHVAVKEAVLPFNRFPDVDTVLGPEMRSTGEVMGIDRSFGLAFAKSQAAARATAAAIRARCSSRSPTATSRPGLVAARRFAELGFSLVATAGTAAALAGRAASASRRSSGKVGEATVGRRRGRADLVGQGRPRGQHAPGPRAPRRRRPHPAGRHRARRRRASPRSPPRSPPRPGIAEWSRHEPEVRSLQEYHRDGQLRLEV